MQKYKLISLLLIGIILLNIIFASGDVDRFDIPFKNEKKLEVDLDFTFGSLNIRPSSNNDYILRAGMTYTREEFKPSLAYKKHNSKGKLSMGTARKEKTF